MRVTRTALDPATALAVALLAATAPALPAAAAPTLPATAAAAAAGAPGAPAEGPPELPTGLGGGCVPRSPTTFGQVPWPQRLLAPQRVRPLTDGRGVLVAVVDSGVSALAPQLAGAVRPGVDVRSPGGRADTDCVGHGTFVAGLIAARRSPRTGFAGVAPGAAILPVRVTDGQGEVTGRALAQGIVAAVEAGARVVNVSVSTPFPSSALRAAVELAERRDVVVVAAVSNRAERGNPRSFPAAYPSVVAVGAIDASGARGAFSNAGAFVDLAAPGVDVVSAGPLGGHYLGSGTSFATPFVAGVAALVRAYRPGLTAAQVRARLEATAVRPPRPVPDPEVGFGVVDPYDAVAALLPEESGARAGPVPVAPLPAPAAPRAAPARSAAALAMALLAVLATTACLLGSRAARAGARRGWRPAAAVPPLAGAPRSGGGAAPHTPEPD